MVLQIAGNVNVQMLAPKIDKFQTQKSSASLDALQHAGVAQSVEQVIRNH